MPLQEAARRTGRWPGRLAALSATGNHDLTLGVTPYKVTFRLQRANRRGIDRPLLDFARQIV
ncbi:MAG TPA: hypothetical protein VIE43_22795 [Thermoanaerobaculia bacterium]|jgi:hypothetical protein|nr:hypothetical protein [Thermoanaerobaculia bacterium]